MCAIAGVIDLYMDAQIQRGMTSTMVRRGPDEEGVYSDTRCVLLHRRLTIVDPEGGKQPMTLKFHGKTYIIAYNGELYNAEEVRRDLVVLGHSFVGYSDTEVLIHAYAQWHEQALDHLNGIFGFAIWTEETKELFVARDRMGVKPLFYMLHDGGLIFASEIKTILAYPTVRAELDAIGAAELILLGPGRTPGSGVLKGVYEIEPGCYGKYSCGKWAWTRYWKLTDAPHEDTFGETVDKVRYLVHDAIHRQLVSDFPVGTFLSGGLDSSLISAVCAQKMKERGECLKTFSLDYGNNSHYFVPGKFQPDSDNAYIETMQKYLGSEQHWTILNSDELMRALEDATYARDLPGMADIDSSLLLLCANIRKYVKVALSGECADEIFGGYPWYRDPAVRDQDGFPWAQNTMQRAQLLSRWIEREIDPYAFVRDRYTQTLNECDILPGTEPRERRMKQMINLNVRWFMQTLLDRKDRMSMYSGLEVRVPFCDYRIAQYMYCVPWEFKDYQGREKGLLRYAMRDILPADVLHRKKCPYPKTFDPAYLKLVKNRLCHIFEDQNAPILQIVKLESVKDLLTAEYEWPWYGQLMRVPQTIAFMLQLNHWMDAYNVQVV